MKVKYSSFSNTVFKESKIIGVNWSEASSVTGSIGEPLHFSKSIINHSTFSGLNLKKITIKECTAKDVDFRDADLTGSDLRDTDFIDTIFLNTNLTEANFTGAVNYSINATANKIKKAKFSLPEAMSLLYGLNIILDE